MMGYRNAASGSGNLRIAPLAVAFGLLSLLTAPPAAAQFTPFQEAIARFDAEVAKGVAEDGAGCVSVAVFEGARIIWSKGYGWADIERQVAATEETIGRIGSITKSFTAVAVMQLAERGILGLDDAVEKHFPEIRGLAGPLESGGAITFRMLASHTAGLVREPDLPGAASGSIYRWEQKLLESIPRTGFRTPPGTEYSYSNIGYGILGLAASRAAGVPYMELVAGQILRPLGMSSSTFVVDTPEMAARLSVGYTRIRGTGAVSAEASTREHLGRGYKVPNGGIYSTVRDLARFAAAVMGETPVPILPEKARREMLTVQPPSAGYGLGFAIREADGVEIIGHGGSVAGYNADLRFEPNSRIGVAVLRTTSYRPPAADLLRRLVALR